MNAHMAKTLLFLMGLAVGCGKPAAVQQVPPLTPQPAALVLPPERDTALAPLPERRPVAGKMNGLTFVAPPEPFPQDPMPAVKNTGATWIAVIPYGFTRMGSPDVRYNTGGGHWWGESKVGITETIRQAHVAGLKTMLKPQVYIPGGWTGSLDFPTDTAWAQWEAAYRRYILDFAGVAQSAGADLFCIGTEFRTAIAKRPAFWKELVSAVRQVYKGKLTYSSNWDDWDKVPFWESLDYIGLSGYFPLVEGATPEVSALRRAWRPIRDKLEAFSKKHEKPILFTEFGYLSVDGCGWRNWELEQGIRGRSINEQAQANCIEALMATFQSEPWWAGGFLWKWFPNMRGHEGYPERDYTPQQKIGEKTLTYWYGGK